MKQFVLVGFVGVSDKFARDVDPFGQAGSYRANRPIAAPNDSLPPKTLQTVLHIGADGFLVGTAWIAVCQHARDLTGYIR